MKKIMVFAVGVLFSTLVFAHGTDEPTTSSVAVMNSGYLFKVFYKAQKSNDVTISIRNEKEKVVFSETMKKTDGFMRPYNFEDLPEGQYTIEVKDESGTQIQKINYGALKIEKRVNLSKITSEKGVYLLTGFSKGSDKIIIRIYDEEGRITYEETRSVDGQFIQVYNLKNLEGPFSIEVSDYNGVLKTLHS